MNCRVMDNISCIMFDMFLFWIALLRIVFQFSQFSSSMNEMKSSTKFLIFVEIICSRKTLRCFYIYVVLIRLKTVDMPIASKRIVSILLLLSHFPNIAVILNSLLNGIKYHSLICIEFAACLLLISFNLIPKNILLDYRDNLILKYVFAENFEIKYGKNVSRWLVSRIMLSLSLISQIFADRIKFFDVYVFMGRRYLMVSLSFWQTLQCLLILIETTFRIEFTSAVKCESVGSTLLNKTPWSHEENWIEFNRASSQRTRSQLTTHFIVKMIWRKEFVVIFKAKI